MTPEQFADYLLSHQWKENECIEFALTDQSTEDVQDFTDWWFCIRVTYPEYISDNILLDYCGGGYPHAFSLDDEELFKELIVEYFTEFRAIGFIQVLHGLAHSFVGPSIYAQGYVFMSKFLYKCKDNSLMALLLAHDSITFPMAYEPRYVWPIIDASASRTLSGRNMVFILTSLENQWQVEHTYWQKALANPVIQRFHTGYTSIWKNMLMHYTANTTIQ